MSREPDENVVGEPGLSAQYEVQRAEQKPRPLQALVWQKPLV